MRHVFVESNWVFACCAPRHLRSPFAELLLQKARAGELRLHLPAICLREGGDAIRKKCQPRVPEEMSDFLTAARQGGSLSHESAHAVSQALNLYRSTVSREIQSLNATLDSVRTAPGVEVFALSEPMLERAIQLRVAGPDGLKPFDEAILAAILVKARTLREHHASDTDFDLAFCTRDGDLQPWTREGLPREPLFSLYEREGVWVYGDFSAVAGAP
jgi:hypothetical protein